MAHLSLRIGAAIPVPIGRTDPAWLARGWRRRALRELASQASRDETWPADQLAGERSRHVRLQTEAGAVDAGGAG